MSDSEGETVLFYASEEYIMQALNFLVKADEDSDPYKVEFAWSVVRPYAVIH